MSPHEAQDWTFIIIIIIIIIIEVSKSYGTKVLTTPESHTGYVQRADRQTPQLYRLCLSVSLSSRIRHVYLNYLLVGLVALLQTRK